MKKYYFSLTVFATVLLSNPVKSQDNTFQCGQHQELQEIKNKAPELYQQMEQKKQILDQHTKNFETKESSERGTVYTIPVVFHIVHNYGVENITDEQVHDAMRILNEDFRLTNPDASFIIPQFQNVAGDAEIEFKLAQLDPAGNCTNGIVRVASLETYVGANRWNNPALSNLSRWPRERYLNVWVVNQIGQGGVAGYSNYPFVFDSQPLIDGLVILHNHVGSIGTSNDRNSRTLTHEIGHWLNLKHPWGDSNNPGLASNCNDDDDVADTPNTIGWTSCNLNGETCGSLDNVQNHMDYSYCSRMFTKGQATRMRAALTSSVAARNNLWTAANLNATGVITSNLCKARFEVNKFDICAGQSINVSDHSFNNPTNWNWVFQGGTPASSTQSNATVKYNNPGTYTIQLSVSDGNKTQSVTENNIITVWDNNGSPAPFHESFDVTSFPNERWLVNNPDEQITWELTTLPDGNKVIMLDNIRNVRGRIDELVSSTIDASKMESVAISFDLAYAQRKSDDNDELELFFSTNCGETWTRRWSRRGDGLATVKSQSTPFTPTKKEDWQTFELTNLPGFFKISNLRFKFVFTSGNGNNIYLDNISFATTETVGIESAENDIENIKVYPNPFRNETTIEFTLENPRNVQMSLTDMLGKESVLLPANHMLQAGNHKFRLSKSEMNLSEGIYFLRIIADGKPQVHKLVVQ